MNHDMLNRLNKGLFIFLVVLAAIATLIAMVAGPLGHDTLSIGASASAVTISGSLLLYVFQSAKK